MRPLSVVFAGTSAFAVPSLKALAADPRFDVQLVITQPDRPVGRKQTLTPPAVKVAALELGLQVIQPEKLNDLVKNPIPALRLGSVRPESPEKDVSASGPEPGRRAEFRFPIPDYLVVVSYGQLLSEQVLALPKIAPINVHASLLPRWRGASPLQHTLLAGDAESGVAIQKIVKALDAGAVLAQHKTAIDPRETFTTLHDRLAAAGAALLIKTLTSPLHPQDQDPAGITLCGKLTRADGESNPLHEDAPAIDRKVRALTPWPGVTINWHGEPLKLIETALDASADSAPLPCADGTTLHLLKVQPAGKKVMSGKEWMRGVR